MLYVCRHSLLPLSLMHFFYTPSMAKNIINHIGTYNDHSKSITINGANTNVSDLLRSFMAEDVEPIQEEKTDIKHMLPFFVPDKLTELGTYSILEFEALYHQAVKGGAPKLAKFIKHYRKLKVLDTKDLNKKETFEQLKAFFGDELNYEYPNFAAYY